MPQTVFPTRATEHVHVIVKYSVSPDVQRNGRVGTALGKGVGVGLGEWY